MDSWNLRIGLRGLRTGILLGALVSALGAGHVFAGTAIVKAGDRIAIIGNTFADQLRTHGYLETLLLQRSEGNPISLRNLGWGGDTVDVRDRPTNFPSEATTLTVHRTDLIIACFGMGESFGGKSGLETFETNLSSLIDLHANQRYNGRSAPRLVLVSPIAYENLGDKTPNHERRNRDLALYTKAMERMAKKKDVHFIDLYQPTSRLMSKTETTSLTTNGIHLNANGYWAVSRIMAEQLLPGTSPWRIRLDATSNTGSAENAQLKNVRASGDGIQFSLSETTHPSLAPEGEISLTGALGEIRDQIEISGLRDGEYQLEVDGEIVATGSHEDWARGVAVDASPTHRLVERYRKAIVDKNQQFVYSWKALNQVHIVGERRKSPSGRELPREVIEFSNLVKEREAALGEKLPLEMREWRLIKKRD